MSSSPCFSVPTTGETSVSTSTLIIWMDGALAFRRTPKRLPWRIRSGSRNEISSRIGVTIPYPVSLTSASEAATLSYSLFAMLNC